MDAALSANSVSFLETKSKTEWCIRGCPSLVSVSFGRIYDDLIYFRFDPSIHKRDFQKYNFSWMHNVFSYEPYQGHLKSCN